MSTTNSIITPKARKRCELEAKRLADLRVMRELQIALALKTINTHYDALEQGKEPPQLGRRLFDRRDASFCYLHTRTAPQPVADMGDVDLHLSAP